MYAIARNADAHTAVRDARFYFRDWLAEGSFTLGVGFATICGAENKR